MKKLKMLLLVVFIGMSVNIFAEYTEIEKSRIIKELRTQKLDGFFTPTVQQLIDWSLRVSDEIQMENEVELDIYDGEGKMVDLFGIKTEHLNVYVPFVKEGDKLYVGRKKVIKEFGSIVGAPSGVNIEFINSGVRFYQDEVIQFVKNLNRLPDEVKKDKEAKVKNALKANREAIEYYFMTGEINSYLKDMIVFKLKECEIESNPYFKTVGDLWYYILNELWKFDNVRNKIETPTYNSTSDVHTFVFARTMDINGRETDIYISTKFSFFPNEDATDIEVIYGGDRNDSYGIDIRKWSKKNPFDINSKPTSSSMTLDEFLKYYFSDKDSLEYSLGKVER